ncbi:hypothetical protein BDZ45DRAFT_672425 [Acephala macrosclerotiorum]|nr:hypothetical protein BDZ45DRAFT_672425 [Acephala macrosclerotiorum]
MSARRHVSLRPSGVICSAVASTRRQALMTEEPTPCRRYSEEPQKTQSAPPLSDHHSAYQSTAISSPRSMAPD